MSYEAKRRLLIISAVASVAASATMALASSGSSHQADDNSVGFRFKDAPSLTRAIAESALRGGKKAGMGGAEASSVWINNAGNNPNVFFVFAPPGGGGGDPVEPPPPLLYSDANNWAGGVVPNAGGVATFNRPGPAGELERLGDITYQLDISPTLSRIEINNSRGVEMIQSIANPGGTSVNIAAGGLTIANNGFFPEPASQAFAFFGSDFRGGIAGTAGVTVTGRNALAFGGYPKTFTGGLTVDGGIISLIELAATTTNFGGMPFLGDAALGGGGSTLTLQNGGQIRVFSNAPTPTPVELARPIVIGTGGGEIRAGGSTPLTVSSPISGTGKLRWFYPGTIVVNGTSTHTGETEIESATVRLTGGNGTWQSSVVRVLNRLDIESGNNNRIRDDATIALHGGTLVVGSSGGNYQETIGTLELREGHSNMTLVGGTGGPLVLTAGNLVRNPGGGLFVRGLNVGAGAPANNRTNLVFGNGEALEVGGGGGAGTTNISIIPFIWAQSGISAATVGTLTGAGGGSLVTHDPVNGIRPLNLTTEYVQNFSGAAATSNVRVTADVTLSGSNTINALLHGSATNSNTGARSTISGGTINVTSGTILNTTEGNTIASNINFGSAQGIILSSSNNNAPDSNPLDGHNGFHISGAISGTGGLVKVGQGHLYLTGANTYTGDTYLTAGRVLIYSDVKSDGVTPGPFGRATSAIKLGSGAANFSGGGSSFLRLLNETAGTITIDRPIEVTGQSQNAIQIGGFEVGSKFVLNGNLALLNTATDLGILQNEVTINGNISGPGGLSNAGGSIIRLNGDNSGWSGPLEMNSGGGVVTGEFIIGSNTATGTGPMWFGPAILRAKANTNITIGNDITVDATEAAPIVLDSNGGVLTLAGTFNFGGILKSVVVTGGGEVRMDNAINGAFQLLQSYTQAPAYAQANVDVTVTPGKLVLSGPSELDSRIYLGDAGFPSAATPVLPEEGGTLRVTHSQGLGEAQVQIESNGSALEFGNNVNISERTYFIRPGTFGIANAGAIRATDGNNTISGLLLYRGALGDDTLLSGSLGSSIGVEAGASLKVDGTIFDFTGAFTEGVGGNADTRAPGNLELRKVGGGLLEVGAVVADELILNPTDPTDNISVERAFTKIDVQAGTLKLALSPVASPNDHHLWVKDITIAGGASPSATLDITDNTVVIDYSASDPTSTVLAQLQSGRNGGAWNGAGIITSAVIPGTKGIAIANAAAYIAAPNTPDDFASAVVALGLRDEVVLDATSLILAFTLRGDVNIDGGVAFSDLLTIAQNYGTTSGAGWLLGDSDYNGTVDFDDLLGMAQNYGTSVLGEAVDHGEFAHLVTGDLFADWATARALVPEPATLGLLAGAGLLAMRRRRA